MPLLVTVVASCAVERQQPLEVQSSEHPVNPSFFLPMVWMCSLFRCSGHEPVNTSVNGPAVEVYNDSSATEGPTTDVPTNAATSADVLSRQTRDVSKLKDMLGKKLEKLDSLKDKDLKDEPESKLDKDKPAKEYKVDANKECPKDNSCKKFECESPKCDGGPPPCQRNHGKWH